MQKKLLFVPAFVLVAACGAEPSPVVVGNISTNTMRQALTTATSPDVMLNPELKLDVEINGDARAVDLGLDGSFAVQELPAGQLHFQVAIEGIKGTLELDDVQPGEVIEIGVEAAPGMLELSVVRRDAMLPPEMDDTVTHSGDIEIRGHKIVHHLPHGRIDGDIVINGSKVTVVGPDYYGCREGGRTVLAGDLIINGHDVRVVNLEIEGRTQINGDKVKVYEPCYRHYRRGHRYDD